MNQDLEIFIKAYLAVREVEQDERAGKQADFDALVERHLPQGSEITREMLLESIRRRALAVLTAQTRTPSNTPKA